MLLGSTSGGARAETGSLAPALRGFYLEAAGDREGALAALRDAVAADAESVELRGALAELLVGSRKLDGALALLDEGLARRPGQPRLLLFRARLQDLMGRREEAAATALEAAAKGAGDEGYGLAVRLLELTGKAAEAEEAARRWAAESPKSADPLLAMGQLKLTRGDKEGARDALTRALELSPGHLESLRTLAGLEEEAGHGEAAAALYRKVVDSNPHDAEARFRLAQLLLKLGRTDEALALLTESQRWTGSDPALALRLGVLFLQADRAAEAETVLRPYAQAHGEDSRGLYLFGVTLLAQKKYEEALAVLGRIPKGAEEYPDALSRRAAALEGLGKREESVKLLEDWLSEHPDDEEVAVSLADLHDDHGNPRAGVDLLERLLARKPSQNPRFYFALGILYDKLKDWAKSVEYMKRSLALAPDDPVVLNYLGYTYADQGVNLEEAEKLVRRALDLKPDDGAITDSLGWVYYKQGRKADAVAALRKAVELSPKDAVIWEHLGDALRAAGDVKGAREAYRKAVEADPGYEAAKKKLEELR
jgi:tetratricopeptide (TPR) repeat protein